MFRFAGHYIKESWKFGPRWAGLLGPEVKQQMLFSLGAEHATDAAQLPPDQSPASVFNDFRAAFPLLSLLPPLGRQLVGQARK